MQWYFVPKGLCLSILLTGSNNPFSYGLFAWLLLFLFWSLFYFRHKLWWSYLWFQVPKFFAESGFHKVPFSLRNSSDLLSWLCTYSFVAIFLCLQLLWWRCWGNQLICSLFYEDTGFLIKYGLKEHFSVIVLGEFLHLAGRCLRYSWSNL